MKIKPKRRLFWFLKKNASLDLKDPATLDSYVQQILSRGNTQDVKSLLKKIGFKTFRESFERIKKFLPQDVRSFWEHFFADH